MKPRSALIALSLLALAVGGLFSRTAIASAHERRNVGPLTFIVGFLNEPALLNEPNSIDLRISHTADSSPVSGGEKTLKAEINYQDQKLPMDLEPRFNTPGAYNAYFTPTKTGTYAFHFTGTLEGTPIDQMFTSSPSTFSNVEDPKAFPATLPAVQDVDATVQDVSQRLGALKSTSSSGSGSSSSKANTALIIGIAGLVAGLAGLGLGAYSMTRRTD